MNILHTLAQSRYYYDDSYYSSSSSLSDADAAALGTAILAFVFIYLLLVIGLYVVASICLMKIFKKAGIKPWIAWVPFYNNWKLLEIGGQQGFWAILAIIPIVNIVSAVFMIIAMYNIGLKLGKSGGFVALAIFLPLVWLIWLAADKSVWNEAAGAPSLAHDQMIPSQPAQPTPPTPPVTPTM